MIITVSLLGSITLDLANTEVLGNNVLRITNRSMTIRKKL